MKLTKRIQRLRDESYSAKVRLSAERAEIITDFYRENAGKYSTPVLRAMALREICEKKTIYIGADELIVGERGPAPRVVPTYPEVACNSIQDFKLLASQDRIPYEADGECLRIYEEKVIPYWRGRSLRDRMFQELDEEWKNAYEAGLFTEFMEQRAPGTPSLDETFYHTGLRDMQVKIRQAMDSLDFFHDPGATDKREELKAMLIGCDAVIRLAERHALLAEEMAQKEPDGQRRTELLAIAGNCRRVPAHAPRTLWEALQMYWFLHIGIITEINGWDACNPGHADRHFYPFYRRDIDNGTIREDFAKELLCAWWIKFNNQPAPAKYGVTAQESGSYNDFVNINLGGVYEDGSDAVNELSYVFLDIMDEIHLIQPQANIQLSEKNPDEFLKAACRVIRSGYGYPSLFNSENTVAEQLYCGKTLTDARSGGTNGCVETTCHGKEAAIDTGYLNVPKLLELTLHDGIDPRTGKQIGLHTGPVSAFAAFDEFFAAFETQVRHMVDLKISRNQYIEQMWAQNIPVPFLSVLIKDCISKGRDYNAGGPRYNNDYIMCVGLGTISDCMSAIRCHIYDKQDVTWERMLKALDTNFREDAILRQLLMNQTPRYGNDDEYADQLMGRISDMLIDSINNRPNSKGGQYHAVMLPTTCHIYFGSVTGATPDGRLAHTPLSEGISGVQGATRNGPTAAMKSAARLKHDKVCGALLNMKLSPDMIRDEDGIDKMAKLIRGYFKMGTNHVQFNIVDKETLLHAQREPERYKDLIVRVAGYSDYFWVLGKELQDEIIARTEHE